MAITALILYMIFGVPGFLVAQLDQCRHTGSTGFPRVTAAPDRWFAGAGFVAAIPRRPGRRCCNCSASLTPAALPQAPTIQTTGTVFGDRGIAATPTPNTDMANRRIGVDPSETNIIGPPWGCSRGAQPHLHRHADLRRQDHP